SEITVKYDSRNYSVQWHMGFISTFTQRTDIDLALLQIVPSIPTPHFLHVQKSISELHIGTDIYFAGYPLNQTTLTFHKGMVSSFPPHVNGINHFTIDGTIVKGNSGGPVIQVEKDRLVLIGIIFESVADVNEKFFLASEVLEHIRMQPPQGLVMTISSGQGDVKSISETQMLLDIIDVLKKNLSTGIGKALHAQHITQMTQLTGISPSSDATKTPTQVGITLTAAKGLDEAVLKTPSHMSKPESTPPSSDPLPGISDPIRSLCQFIIDQAKNNEACQLAQQALGSDTIEPFLSQIRKLDLTGCALDTLPDAMSALVELEYLDLTANFLSALPESLCNLSNLKVLNLRGNHFTVFPECLCKIPSLNKVDILENPLRAVPISMRKVIWDLPPFAKWI
ncbi:MAG: hypothetical protein K940chlam7_01619, partial [Chlamydiae bacterium]|nr:hypothetical protein [Chlamydiota bacterium]